MKLQEKYVGFGIVRDASGRPKIDDPSALHPVQVLLMTESERAELGLWQGAWARDADGFKKLTRVSDTVFRAEEDLRAVSEVFVNHHEMFRLMDRVDVAKGDQLSLNL